jgi:hypothetical protein
LVGAGKKKRHRLYPKTARIINTEHSNFETGWIVKIFIGVKANKTISEPINPPTNNLHIWILLFKNMAVR